MALPQGCHKAAQDAGTSTNNNLGEVPRKEMSCDALRQHPSRSLPQMQLSPSRPLTPTFGRAAQGLTRLEEVQLTLQVVKHLHRQLKTKKKGCESLGSIPAATHGPQPIARCHPTGTSRCSGVDAPALPRGSAHSQHPWQGWGEGARSSPWFGCAAGEAGQCCATLPASTPLPCFLPLPHTHKLLTSFSPASSSCRSDIWRLPGKRGFCMGKEESGKGFGGFPALATALGTPGSPTRLAASVQETGTALWML